MSYVRTDTKMIKKRLANRARRGLSNHIEIYVRKTNKHIYAVAYDTISCKELFCFSTLNMKGAKPNKESSYEIGKGLANWLVKNSIKNVYFNKLNYKFHGKLVEVVRGINEVAGNII